ncbi:hypothetical protein OsJ_28987 [Oryza sativa Japonica Group]|uniref:Uncharacterized protein n=2 Tax=Oryza TaxID=4527 RepID=B9G327_ORYSJ|nr:hypothetical protein OsJ_28987 [Oryza sativa Japonica Group]
MATQLPPARQCLPPHATIASPDTSASHTPTQPPAGSPPAEGRATPAAGRRLPLAAAASPDTTACRLSSGRGESAAGRRLPPPAPRHPGQGRVDQEKRGGEKKDKERWRRLRQKIRREGES